MDKLSEEIARVAYDLYEKRGRAEGSHFDDWVEAEKIVMARHAKGVEAVTVKRRAVGRPRKEEAGIVAKAAPKKRATAKKKAAPKRAT
jgi:hypothetical protein